MARAPSLTDFGRALLTMWRGVLGQFDLGWVWGSAWQQLSIIFFSAFMFIVQIVLLNMLIAMMREIYNKVKHTEEDVFLKGRAQLIVEVETLMAKKQLERYANMPPYVHLLTPVKRKDVRERSGAEAKLERLEQLMMKLNDALDQGLAGPRGGGGGGNGMGGGGMGGGGAGNLLGDGSNINTSALSQEQLNLIQMQAGKIKVRACVYRKGVGGWLGGDGSGGCRRAVIRDCRCAMLLHDHVSMCW